MINNNNKPKVLWIINNVPNYRNVLVEALSKELDLTVISFDGSKIGLKNPNKRTGYNYVEINEKQFFGFFFNSEEYPRNIQQFDAILLGFDLKHPMRILNVLRPHKKIIFTGMIYGKSKSILLKWVRKFWLERAHAVLVYSDFVRQKLEKEINQQVIAYNNTNFHKNDIKILPFSENETNELNVLWVGRYQKRKKVEKLIEIANRYKQVNIRIIGPQVKESIDLPFGKNVSIYEELYDDKELEKHFQWAHVVMNPGHVGLLVMNAARFGRPIIIQNDSYQAPEIQLAIESDQIFLNFNDNQIVDKVITELLRDKRLLIKKGRDMALIMKEKYTIEFSVQQFLKVIN